jgi:hypothetical protein
MLMTLMMTLLMLTLLMMLVIYMLGEEGLAATAPKSSESQTQKLPQ